MCLQLCCCCTSIICTLTYEIMMFICCGCRKVTITAKNFLFEESKNEFVYDAVVAPLSDNMVDYEELELNMIV